MCCALCALREGSAAPQPRCPPPQETKALFLEAQARWGLGEVERAAQLAAEVLARDPAHGMAADLAAEIRGAQPGAGGPAGL